MSWLIFKICALFVLLILGLYGSFFDFKGPDHRLTKHGLSALILLFIAILISILLEYKQFKNELEANNSRLKKDTLEHERFDSIMKQFNISLDSLKYLNSSMSRFYFENKKEAEELLTNIIKVQSKTDANIKRLASIAQQIDEANSNISLSNRLIYNANYSISPLKLNFILSYSISLPKSYLSERYSDENNEHILDSMVQPYINICPSCTLCIDDKTQIYTLDKFTERYIRMNLINSNDEISQGYIMNTKIRSRGKRNSLGNKNKIRKIYNVAYKNVPVKYIESYNKYNEFSLITIGDILEKKFEIKLNFTMIDGTVLRRGTVKGVEIVLSTPNNYVIDLSQNTWEMCYDYLLTPNYTTLKCLIPKESLHNVFVKQSTDINTFY